MVARKAQSAIEFITAYSWAFLLLLVVGFLAFYYITSQQTPSQCSFGTDLHCQSYQFVQNSSGDMKLTIQLSNGMGKAVSFTDPQTITVTNIGKTGTNVYNGSCWSINSTIVRGGDPIYCSFDILDKDVVPSINREVKFDVALNYVDCETAPNYPNDCNNALNRTYRGSITTPFEARPSGIPSFCGDGVCSGVKTCSNCPQDCKPCNGPACLPNCTFNGVCNSSCAGINGCSGFYRACNNYSSGLRCSDSSGGTTGALNYMVQCCNVQLSTAINCYQNTSTTVGYCGDRTCDSIHGENCTNCPADCGTCPSLCLSDCTMGDNICHASCLGTPAGCSSAQFKPTCDGWALNAIRCSNSTGGTALEGGWPALNFSVSCCNGLISQTQNCYQNTSTTVGYCSDHNCALSRGENCANCPADCGVCAPTCQQDCTLAGVCNSACSGTYGCLNPLTACNGNNPTTSVCSNSSGGTATEGSPPGLFYNASCCNGTITPCGSNSTCLHTTAWCNGTNQNCTADTLIGGIGCNMSCSGGSCATYCQACTTGTCALCPGGQTCQGAGVCTSAFYQNSTNLCGYYNGTSASCGAATTFCTSGTYFPIQACSATPTFTSCQAETASASCATCGNCTGAGDTCAAAVCGSSLNCSNICTGAGTGSLNCIAANSLPATSSCLCNSVCGSGNCSSSLCAAYYANTPGLCGYYYGNSSTCASNPSTNCASGYYFPSTSCTSTTSGPPSCQAETSSTSCTVCGNCFMGTCAAVNCGTTNSFGCLSGKYCGGTLGNCQSPFASGASCNCSQQCTSGYCNTSSKCAALFYKSTTNQCGFTTWSNAACSNSVATTNCASGTYYPTQACSSSPTLTSCTAETTSTSCGGICTNCDGAGTCGTAACGTTYGCSGGNVCNGQGTGGGNCVPPGGDGATCYCNAMCTLGDTCKLGICTYAGGSPLIKKGGVGP